MRVMGIFFWVPYTRLGFSPKAHFMATGYFKTMSSTRLPCILMATKVPPTTLPLPGPVTAVVTPAAAAWASVSSMG